MRKFNILSYLRNIFRFGKLIRIRAERTLNRQNVKTLTVAIIHYDGKNLEDILNEFSLELSSADVIVGKNLTKEDLPKLRRLLSKDVILLDNSNVLLYRHGKHIHFLNSFDVHKLRAFENQRTFFIVVLDKKIGWMISQMFPFYCIIPGEPFQDTLITAPIPLTRSSDGYYFSKITYRNQVTLVDLNVEILRDFASI